MQILIILNEKPTTNEKAYNALRIAAQFQKDDVNNKIVIYLLADGVMCAIYKRYPGPGGVLNVEQMMEGIIRKRRHRKNVYFLRRESWIKRENTNYRC